MEDRWKRPQNRKGAIFEFLYFPDNDTVDIESTELGNKNTNLLVGEK